MKIGNRLLAIWVLVIVVVVSFVYQLVMSLKFTDQNQKTPDLPHPPTNEQFKVSRVIDGDTIELESGQVVRYIGIDTPETKNPTRSPECFGTEATGRNRQLVEGKLVRLERDVSEVDRYGRLLRYVWVGDDLINQRLVAEGFAQAASYPPDISRQEQFRQAEQLARKNQVGLWSSCENEVAASTSSSQVLGADNECLIKGNISDAGWYYHLKTCPSYAVTKISVSQGERWFCSESEAVAAGWQKAPNCD